MPVILIETEIELATVLTTSDCSQKSSARLVAPTCPERSSASVAVCAPAEILSNRKW